MPESWKPDLVGTEFKRENRAEALREWMTKSKMFKDTPFPMFFPTSSLARDLSSAIFCIFWLKEVMYSMKLMTEGVGGRDEENTKAILRSQVIPSGSWTEPQSRTFNKIIKR